MHMTPIGGWVGGGGGGEGGTSINEISVRPLCGSAAFVMFV